MTRRRCPTTSSYISQEEISMSNGSVYLQTNSHVDATPNITETLRIDEDGKSDVASEKRSSVLESLSMGASAD